MSCCHSHFVPSDVFLNLSFAFSWMWQQPQPLWGTRPCTEEELFSLPSADHWDVAKKADCQNMSKWIFKLLYLANERWTYLILPLPMFHIICGCYWSPGLSFHQLVQFTLKLFKWATNLKLRESTQKDNSGVFRDVNIGTSCDYYLYSWKKPFLFVPLVLRTQPLRTLLPSPSPVSSPPEHLHNWM